MAQYYYDNSETLDEIVNSFTKEPNYEEFDIEKYRCILRNLNEFANNVKNIDLFKDKLSEERINKQVNVKNKLDSPVSLAVNNVFDNISLNKKDSSRLKSVRSREKLSPRQEILLNKLDFQVNGGTKLTDKLIIDK